LIIFILYVVALVWSKKSSQSTCSKR